MTNKIVVYVPKELANRTTQEKAVQALELLCGKQISDDIYETGRVDWFIKTELYRLGLRRKGGNE